MAQPQTVIVTGATSGIGRAAADLLTREGYVVFGTSRTPSRESGVGFEMLPLDVRSDSSVDACVATVLERTGRLDVLVNNAGFLLVGAAEETSIEEAKAQLETNFFGVVRMTRAALRVMRRQGAGRIVQVGSLIGHLAIPFAPFYSASKFALSGYSEALWHELEGSGIDVSVVEPSFVRTHLSTASRVVGSDVGPNAAARARVAGALNRGTETGTPPDRVAHTILQAIRSRSPRFRYRVGFQATFLPVFKELLPWSAFAGRVRKVFDVDGPAGRDPGPAPNEVTS